MKLASPGSWRPQPVGSQPVTLAAGIGACESLTVKRPPLSATRMSLETAVPRTTRVAPPSRLRL